MQSRKVKRWVRWAVCLSRSSLVKPLALCSQNPGIGLILNSNKQPRKPLCRYQTMHFTLSILTGLQVCTFLGCHE